MVERIPKLTQRLELQARPSDYDGAGGHDGAWTTVTTVWGEVLALSGALAVEASIATQTTRYRVTIRRRELPTAGRFLWSGWRLLIRAVEDNGPRARYLVVTCEGTRA